jgi:hypothetical protein
MDGGWETPHRRREDKRELELGAHPDKFCLFFLTF